MWVRPISHLLSFVPRILQVMVLSCIWRSLWSIDDLTATSCHVMGVFRDRRGFSKVKWSLCARVSALLKGCSSSEKPLGCDRLVNVGFALVWIFKNLFWRRLGHFCLLTALNLQGSFLVELSPCKCWLKCWASLLATFWPSWIILVAVLVSFIRSLLPAVWVPCKI